ncbi:hypothetical protein BS329_09150 [Amycolatopsis coloradensis]|uniref:Uncharacterized protein n=1 Tax=Amycolatopsis coloradensis TaxID=76021 RepID=A0A1R0KZ15_9PSEU|nr:hypothetical protein BS329_09150 [Amycolatopsis coloradensis]
MKPNGFREREPDDAAELGGGVMLAVGLVLAFFTWWLLAAIVHTAAGVLRLALIKGAERSH